MLLNYFNSLSRLARNISSLLKPGGQAYVVLVVDSGVYKVWDSLVKSDKWSTFFQVSFLHSYLNILFL